MDGSLRDFFRKHKLWVVGKGTNERVTHTLLDGGKVNVRDDLVGEMLIAYMNDLNQNVPLYLNELPSYFCAMRWDIDLETNCLMGEGDLDELMRIAHTECVSKFFPGKEDSDPLFESIVCEAEAKRLNGGEGGSGSGVTLWKQGFHVLYPRIVVSSEEGLLMRESFLSALDRHMRGRHALNGWPVAIDPAVYISSGLRYYGSRKTVPCEGCKGRRSEECSTCGGKGKKDEGRPYLLKAVFQGPERDSKKEADYHKNTLKLLKNVSIRRPSSVQERTDGWTRYEGCPAYMGENSGGGAGGKRKRLPEDRNGTFFKHKTLVRDCETLSILLRTIQRFGPHYRNIQIERVFKDNKGKLYVDVSNEGSNFCLNLGRDHNRRKIWFLADKFGMVQRCFCSCDTTSGRKKGTCKNFSSHPKLFSEVEKVYLFPESSSGSAPKVAGMAAFSQVNKMVGELFGPIPMAEGDIPF